jgi:hypothetical protein
MNIEDECLQYYNVLKFLIYLHLNNYISYAYTDKNYIYNYIMHLFFIFLQKYYAIII